MTEILSQQQTTDTTATVFSKAVSWHVEIAYDGSGYLGWQRQPHGVTVQEVLEERLSRLYGGRPIHCQAAGRTDAGVHAAAMSVSFSAPYKPWIDADKILRACRGMLPAAIAPVSAREVSPDFDARFSAVGKAYTYVIRREANPNPFLSKRCWDLPECRRDEALAEAAGHLVGTHDFSSFAVELSKSKKDPVRTIYRIETQVFGPFLCVTFVGNGFLYKMIRSVIGTLAFVGTGRLTSMDVKEILEARDRSAAYDTAPPDGLYMMKVFYDRPSLDGFRLQAPPFLL